MRLHILLLLVSLGLGSSTKDTKNHTRYGYSPEQRSALTRADAQVTDDLQQAGNQQPDRKASKQELNPAIDPKPFMSHAEWIMAILTSIYVFLTAVYVLYSRKTLIELQRQIGLLEKQDVATQKQIEIAKASANAALLNAKAAMVASRPFLMIELRNKDQIWIVNKGKIPAQIVWYNPCGSLTLRSHEETDNMPENFNYGHLHDSATAEVINVPWIAPDGEMHLTDFAWIGLESELTEAYRSGQKYALFLSTVKYRGMLTDTVYESRWCFRWLGKEHGLRLAGPPGYNSYT